MSDRTVQYVPSGDGLVAYSTFGSGPVDLLLIDDWAWHLEAVWDNPDTAEFYERLGSFARVVMWNRRGVGLSDPLPLDQLTTIDSGLEDVLAVLDAAGLGRVAVMGGGGGVPLAAVLAATHPERVTSLVLASDGSRLAWGDDRSGADAYFEGFIKEIETRWGTGVTAAGGSPSRAGDPGYVAWMAKMERLTASPRTAAAMWRATYATDLSKVLPLIAVPTLVIHMLGNLLRDSHLAELIPDARYLELPGDLDWTGTDDGRVADAIEEFLTGECNTAHSDRVLATILFTDIVESTERASSLGDHRWRALLDAHDQVVRDSLRRFRGREIKTTGDGFLASFDGPARAIRCALSIHDDAARIGLRLRIGLHTGECEIRGDDLGGIAVHIAARVAAQAQPGETLVSRTVTDLVAGSNIRFSGRGEHQLKGVPGIWSLFAVTAT